MRRLSALSVNSQMTPSWVGMFICWKVGDSAEESEQAGLRGQGQLHESSKRLSTRTFTWVTTIPCRATDSGQSGWKGAWQKKTWECQLTVADHQLAACPGGREGPWHPWHPGLSQRWSGQQDQGSAFWMTLVPMDMSEIRVSRSCFAKKTWVCMHVWARVVCVCKGRISPASILGRHGGHNWQGWVSRGLQEWPVWERAGTILCNHSQFQPAQQSKLSYAKTSAGQRNTVSASTQTYLGKDRRCQIPKVHVRRPKRRNVKTQEEGQRRGHFEGHGERCIRRRHYLPEDWSPRISLCQCGHAHEGTVACGEPGHQGRAIRASKCLGKTWPGSVVCVSLKS